MAQKYMRFISWDVDLTQLESADGAFSKKRVTRVRKSIEALSGTQYSFETLPLSEELLDEFIVLYTEFMSSKEGGVVYPVKESISENQSKGRKYFIIVLSNDGKMEGGLIFSERKKSLSVAYRFYPNSLDVSTQSSPAQIAEYMVVETAMKMEKERVNHGRDRNAYGLNADIGLASFKMRSGATPFISRTGNEVVELPESFDHDVLVCIGDELGAICDELVLYTDLDEKEALAKYQISKYDKVPVRVEKR